MYQMTQHNVKTHLHCTTYVIHIQINSKLVHMNSIVHTFTVGSIT